MKAVTHILSILLLLAILTSCYKKKKSHDGIYVGEERYIKLHSTNKSDTICDTASLVILEIDLIKLYEYRIWKPEVVDSYNLEVNANKLVRKDTVEGSQWIFPSQSWKVSINDEGLYLYFNERKTLTGKDEHFYFKGIKDY